MNRRLFGAFGAIAVVALAFGSCKSDPLSDSDGTPAALVTDFSYLEVLVAGAQPVTAYVVDARSTPIEEPVTFTACSGVITVTPDTSYHPVPATSSRALVRGNTFGTSCVIVHGAGFEDTVQVATFPAAIVITSGPDTVISGDTAAFTFEYRDASGAPVAGVPAPTWTTNDTLKGKITPATGLLAARDTGGVTVTITGTGSPAEGVSATKPVLVRPDAFTIVLSPNPADPGQVVKLSRDPAGPIFDANTIIRFGTAVQTPVSGSLTADSVKVAIPDVATGGNLAVGVARLGPTEITQSPGALTVNTPAAFGGTVSPTSGVPGTAVTISRTSGPVFDANTRVYFNGVRTFVSSFTASTIQTVVPGAGKKGTVELRMTRLDATELARKLDFTADTASFLLADQYDAVNNDPATAPQITANGDYYVVLSGACANGAGGKDCDDWFRIRNTGGAAATVTINAEWLPGPGTTAATTTDIDLLAGSTAANAGACQFCGGATGANPENVSFSVPAGATYYLWVNLFAAGGAASTVARIRVSGLP